MSNKHFTYLRKNLATKLFTVVGQSEFWEHCARLQWRENKTTGARVILLPSTNMPQWGMSIFFLFFIFLPWTAHGLGVDVWIEFWVQYIGLNAAIWSCVGKSWEMVLNGSRAAEKLLNCCSLWIKSYCAIALYKKFAVWVRTWVRCYSLKWWCT